MSYLSVEELRKNTDKFAKENQNAIDDKISRKDEIGYSIFKDYMNIVSLYVEKASLDGFNHVRIEAWPVPIVNPDREWFCRAFGAHEAIQQLNRETGWTALLGPETSPFSVSSILIDWSE